MAWKVSTGKDGDSHLFVDDKTPDTHHGSSSIIEFDVTLLQFSSGIKVVPSKVKSSVTEITGKLGGFLVQPVSITVDNLGNGEEGEHLKKHVLSIPGIHECLPRCQTIGDVFGTREADSSGGCQVSDDGQHGYSSMLDLTFTKKVESLYVPIRDKLQWIKDTQLSFDNDKEKQFVRIRQGINSDSVFLSIKF